MIRALFYALALPLFRFRVEGVEHVPERGPAVLVAAHRSWLDPACVGAACPRPVRFLIMERVWRLSWANWFFRGMRSLPVQSGGSAPLPALRTALRLLEQGQLIGVFPEGRVLPVGELGPTQAGAALLAVRGRAPVVPVVVHGSAAAWPHGRRWPGPGRVGVRFGAALPPPVGRGRAAVEELMDRIERTLEELGSEQVRP